MEANGCNIDKYIVIRKDFHKHAEIAFKEFRTQQKIIDILKTFGIEDENIVKCAGTGLVVDIKGKMAEDKSLGCHTVALRTDIDALPMPEHN
jgi:metal-dependent amidase/aminoacylase/carboxypeptidase family protein